MASEEETAAGGVDSREVEWNAELWWVSISGLSAYIIEEVILVVEG